MTAARRTPLNDGRRPNAAQQMTAQPNDTFKFSVFLHVLRVSVVPFLPQSTQSFFAVNRRGIQSESGEGVSWRMGDGDKETARPQDCKTKILK